VLMELGVVEQRYGAVLEVLEESVPVTGWPASTGAAIGGRQRRAPPRPHGRERSPHRPGYRTHPHGLVTPDAATGSFQLRQRRPGTRLPPAPPCQRISWGSALPPARPARRVLPGSPLVNKIPSGAVSAGSNPAEALVRGINSSTLTILGRSSVRPVTCRNADAFSILPPIRARRLDPAAESPAQRQTVTTATRLLPWPQAVALRANTPNYTAAAGAAPTTPGGGGCPPARPPQMPLARGLTLRHKRSTSLRA
jgi:hypothetical protein